MGDPAGSATEAAEYKREDGSSEIVFAVEDGRVLTVREYPNEETFETAVESATHVGRHEAVADLPDVEAFRDGE